MIIKLFNFNKKKNSTKTVKGHGTEVNVKLKESTSITSPSFIFEGDLPDFNYVKAFNRYYFINEITSIANNLYQIDCECDVLSTFKAEIGGTSAYVRYASTGYDERIPDTRLSTIDKATIISTEAVAIPDYVIDADNEGTVCLQIINDDTSIATANGLGFYFIGMEGIGLATEIMMTNDSMLEALNKYLNDAYSAIVSVKWIPFNVNLGSTPDHVRVGNMLMECEHPDKPGVFKRLAGLKPTSKNHCRKVLNWLIEIPWVYDDWRRMSPYTSLSLYLPYVGMVDIPVNDYIGMQSIQMSTVVDLVTGDILYRRTRGAAVLDTYKSNCAVELTIGQSQSNVGGVISGLSSVLGNTLSLNVGGTISSIANTALAENQRSLSTVGGNVGGVSTAAKMNNLGKACLTMYTHNTNIEPSMMASTRGRPVEARKTINTLSGYIQCENASISIAGLDSDRDVINSYLNSGFFYE